jgi:hypothetical protein
LLLFVISVFSFGSPSNVTAFGPQPGTASFTPFVSFGTASSSA